MLIKPFLYVANWKMQLSFLQSVEFARQHARDFVDMAQSLHQTIVLCPSFDALFSIAQIFHDTNVYIGSQDCSAIVQGPYTGQVSVRSLKEIGCRYTIVGHSEHRLLSKESEEQIAGKVELLLTHDIIPIICVGENLQAYELGNTKSVVYEQLKVLFAMLRDKKYLLNQMRIYIAYEPVWSIGTDITPSIFHIESVFSMIQELTSALGIAEKVSCLYGGSVHDKNAQNMKQIAFLEGFLIGGASLHFQKFQNIVF